MRSTTGGIVTYDAASRSYSLPPEHAAVLTRAAGVDNLAAMTQFVGMLGAVEQDVVRCFREGGGVPYSSFPTFHRQLGEMTKDTVDATLLDGTLELVPGLRDRLERRHRRRRHRMRLGLRVERPRSRLPEQPVHGLRLLRGSDRRGAQRRPRTGRSTT